MNKTMRISFALKNTYRVNTVLFSLKQLPLIGRLFPDTLYQSRALKAFANIIATIWEIITAIGGKFIYIFAMIYSALQIYKGADRAELFLHIFIFLTVIGAFLNTYMFNPTRDKYYAMVLLRMNAREYTLVNYGYSLLMVIIGFTAFGLVFGLIAGLPIWQCLMIPFFVCGCKLSTASMFLMRFEHSGIASNENQLGMMQWPFVILFTAAAYGLPAIGVILPETACIVIMVAGILSGIPSLIKTISFPSYHEVYHQLLSQSITQMDQAKYAVRDRNQKLIVSDINISSKKSGFEYLNELFIKRHRKILWTSTQRITAVSLILVLGLQLLFYMIPETRSPVNTLLLTFLPYMTFVMYIINRGTNFTSALFMNCDHSLLTYSIYKQPKYILKLFKIRLREIIKINLLPAFVIGGGLTVSLYTSGGTDNPLNYAVLFLSIISMSVFFSVHYLTIYYLLQPYNIGTEIKSAAYRVIMMITYLVCFVFMQLSFPTLIFGGLMIAFSLVYCLVACLLVYKFAAKTFKLRT